MKTFFQVVSLDEVISFRTQFPELNTETVNLLECVGRISAEDHIAKHPLPEFDRSVMDGYALKAADTFGAGEANPAYLKLVGDIAMGTRPAFEVAGGQTAKIATGGMLPKGADAVVMVEHTEMLDDTTVEIQRSVAPGQHVAIIGEDFQRGQVVVHKGSRLRPQEAGVLAAMGIPAVKVCKRAVVGIISTGDEVVPIDQHPAPGQIRDINSYSLASLASAMGSQIHTYPIVPDRFEDLLAACQNALAETDMLMISGGSSVGTRDFSIDALQTLPDSTILAHGIAIRPGKPTILAAVGGKPVWGLPGHVVSAMVVFRMVVSAFLNHLQGGLAERQSTWPILARLTQNVVSGMGRTDFVRVRLRSKSDGLWAEPVLGKSGLIHTMLKADGLIQIDENTEGLEAGAQVNVVMV